MKTRSLRDISTLTFIVTFFIIANIWKQPTRPLTDEWIKIFLYMTQHNGILSSLRTKGILPFATI